MLQRIHYVKHVHDAGAIVWEFTSRSQRDKFIISNKSTRFNLNAINKSDIEAIEQTHTRRMRGGARVDTGEGFGNKTPTMRTDYAMKM